jgi:phage shock protein PspC (stress-responsive transcriptional regulator)
MKFAYTAGQRAFEGYTIVEPLGHGGFGEVYHATSVAGKHVALKLVQRNLDVELRGVSHCLNLKHPNLVTIYDVRTTQPQEHWLETGDHWVIMEFVQGPSLAAVIDQNPSGLPKLEVLRWLEGICAAVEHLHQAGIVHRDLKPSNIFDDRGSTASPGPGVVKVGDYGLSKFITASRRSGHTQSVGTVHYMAPEVGSGRYGREVDIYAVGIILYEMLAGKVPFDGETAAEILMKHLTAEPDLSSLPGPYRPVVARMLAKRPEDRYGSPMAVVSDLKARLADAALLETAAYGEAFASPLGTGFKSGVPTGADAAPQQTPGGVETKPATISCAVVCDVGPQSLPGTSAWSSIIQEHGGIEPFAWTRARRVGAVVREHPVLSSVCVLLTLICLTPLVAYFSEIVLPTPINRPSYISPNWVITLSVWPLLCLVLAVAMCAWVYLWRAVSPLPSTPGALQASDSQTISAKVARPVRSLWETLRRLRRSETDSMLGGVCGGLGACTPIPSWAWRLLFVFLAFPMGLGVAFYFVLWLCIPSEDETEALPVRPHPVAETPRSGEPHIDGFEFGVKRDAPVTATRGAMVAATASAIASVERAAPPAQPLRKAASFFGFIFSLCVAIPVGVVAGVLAEAGQLDRELITLAVGFGFAVGLVVFGVIGGLVLGALSSKGMWWRWLVLASLAGGVGAYIGIAAEASAFGPATRPLSIGLGFAAGAVMFGLAGIPVFITRFRRSLWWRVLAALAVGAGVGGIVGILTDAGEFGYELVSRAVFLGFAVGALTAGLFGGLLLVGWSIALRQAAEPAAISRPRGVGRFVRLAVVLLATLALLLMITYSTVSVDSREGARIVGDNGHSAIIAATEAPIPIDRPTLVRVLDHPGRVVQLSFRPTWDQLTALGDDGTIKSWNHNSGQEMLGLPKVGAFAYDRDGSRLAVGGPEGRVIVYSADMSGKTPFQGSHATAVRLLAFNDDATRLTSVSDDSLRVWDAATGAEISVLEVEVAAKPTRSKAGGKRPAENGGFARSIIGIEFRDYRNLSIVDDHADTWLWDTTTPKAPCMRMDTLPRGLIDGGYSVKSMTFVKDRPGAFYAGLDLGTIYYRSSRGPASTVWPAHRGAVLALANAPGRPLASGGEDGVRFWSGNHAQVAKFPDDFGPVTALAYNSDGTLLAAGGADRKVRLWRLR